MAKEIIVTFPEVEAGKAVGFITLPLGGTERKLEVVPYGYYKGWQQVILRDVYGKIDVDTGIFYESDNFKVEFFFNKDGRGNETGGLNARIMLFS